MKAIRIHKVGGREVLGYEWILDGSLKVRIDETFALAAAADAHRYMEGRRTKGKVLLIP
jgi:NADPH2:quinone reductase